LPYATTSDGTRLYYEEAGSGTPVVFVHEFAGDWRTWEPQLRHLAKDKHCVTFSARGYPPSDVPEDGARYGQDVVRDDVIALMDHLGIAKAHVVGHSMGAYTTLNLGLRYPERCLSLTAAGCGWGSDPATRAESARLCEDIARMFEQEGIETAAAWYADFPMRHAQKHKDPRGWREFTRMLGEHSATGMALTMRHVQAQRPTLWDMAAALKELRLPLLVIVGDEDEPCLDGSLFLKRTVPTAALQVVPRTGHTITSEEPAIFNAALAELFAAVETGRWLAHKPAAAG
jgi:pimeloyl-ACP methyl ester carboxylesterase